MFSMKRFLIGFGLKFVFFMISWITLVPGQGISMEELVCEPVVFQGDPGDDFGTVGVAGILTDGIGSLLPRFLGDPDDGLDNLGDPEDGLDLFRFFGDPGDGFDTNLLPYFGDPLDGVGIWHSPRWFWD